MQLGIFARTFVRPTLDATLVAVILYGLNWLQFNFSCVGLPTLPDSIDPALVLRISTELKKRSLQMVAVSGTCNLIHPDLTQRVEELKRLQSLIAACKDLGASVVTL